MKNFKAIYTEIKSEQCYAILERRAYDLKVSMW